MNDQLPPAAWHPDPDDPSQWRYWDGTQWTDHRAPRTDLIPARSEEPAAPAATEAPVAPVADGSTAATSVPATSMPTAAYGSVVSPPKNRSKLWLGIGGAVLAVLALLLVVEYSSESDSLDAYKQAAAREQSNRDAIETQYQERADRLGQVVQTQGRIDDLHDAMARSDCFTSGGTCHGAVEWNRNLDELKAAFEENASLMSRSQSAINKMHSVKPPEKLWLLTLLGKNSSESIQAELDAYVTRINELKSDINNSIKAIEDWNNDCVEDAVISCGNSRVDLEKET